MPTNRVAKSKPKRTHRLGGCETCRRRHVKCDQKRPRCTTCQQAGLHCEGFPPRIRWASASLGPPSGLESETDNSSALNIRDLSCAEVGVDVEHYAVDVSDVVDRTQGNAAASGLFGAIDFTAALGFSENASKETSQTAQSAAPNLPVSDVALPLANTGVDVADLFGSEGVEPPSEIPGSCVHDFDSILDSGNLLEWSDLFDTGFDFTLPTYENPLPSNDPLRLLTSDSHHSLDHSRPIANWAGLSVSSAQNLQEPFRQDMQYSESSMSVIGSEVLAAAPVFLRYFKNTVVPRFGPLPMTVKSPWNICVYTAAVQAFAEITYMQNPSVKHANRAILFGVVAISAYHAGRSEAREISFPQAECYRMYSFSASRAKAHLRESLQTEISGLHKAKYKDQLMAILTLNAVSSLTGVQQDARCYFIDAERLLRHRGLAKNNLSRRARLLHHLYTWMRIVGESTFTIHNYSKSCLTAQVEHNMQHKKSSSTTAGASNQTGASKDVDHAQLDDFLRVQSHESDSDSDVDAPRDSEAGLRDIHLEDMRYYSQTYYLQVYGIPETWLSLVSQTTRLANVMDIVEASKGQASRQFSDSLQRKMERLEHMVSAFASESYQKFSDARSSFRQRAKVVPSTDETERICTNKAILKAMSSALVIFFYRRIRKVHPWILQSHVTEVVDALKCFDRGVTDDSQYGPGTPWPAFVAGCEATSEADREWLFAWMEKTSKLLASNGVHAALDVMREVWKRRDDASKETLSGQASENIGGRGRSKTEFDCTWVDVLRDRKTWLMLY